VASNCSEKNMAKHDPIFEARFSLNRLDRDKIRCTSHCISLNEAEIPRKPKGPRRRLALDKNQLQPNMWQTVLKTAGSYGRLNPDLPDPKSANESLEKTGN
jgi:hypothetical protein